MAEAKFRFLTTEEFNKLTQAEKIDYLGRATAALHGTAKGWPDAFSDAAVAPARPDEPLEKK
jgi:hypothetical protein